jgi:hypothetical protein
MGLGHLWPSWTQHETHVWLVDLSADLGVVAMPKSFYEVEALIWQAPDELNEEEIENYLTIAEVQTTLSRDNFMALVELDGDTEASAA